MQFFNNLKIGVRLAIAFGIALLMLIVIAVAGLRGIGSTTEGAERIYTNSVAPLKELARVDYLLQRNRVLAMDMIMNPAPDNVAKRAEEQTKNTDLLDEAFKRYTVTDTTPAEKALIAEFLPALQSYRAEGLKPAREASVAGKTADALAIYGKQISPLAPKVTEPLAKLVNLQETLAKQEFDRVRATSASVMVTTVTLAVLACLVTLALAWLITRSITRPLGQALQFSRQVAAGDLTATLDHDSSDEIGALLKSMRDMQASLSTVVSNVRQGAESVATASAEIAQGNNDLSARTEQQASALEQTAASMEQLGATVRQNADTAKQANQLAHSASTVAISGGDVVGQVVETMKGINESSRKISDIISVIDGIAFQTNILALNAAVEAARAGEQGRGFAVVASEVRSLAGRSAEAAKEIKALINASVEKVEQGTAMVDKAGVTMTEVVSSIRRVTDLMSEISAASSEQSAGVSQVGEAVTQLDQATQQNAALVEQMAAAASSLKTQAVDLVQVVGAFKLAPGDRRPPAAVSSVAPMAKAMPRPAARKMAGPVARKAPQLARPAAVAPKKAAPAGGDDEWDEF